MKNKREEGDRILNELIQVNRDGYSGYLEAAKEVDYEPLKELLLKQAFQRNQYFIDLKREAFARGVRPERKRSVLGKAHRAWMHFRHNMNPHRDQVALSECKRGEEYALSVYEDVFENKLLPELYSSLEKQFVSIIEMRDRLNRKDSTSGGENPSVLHLL